MCALCSFAGRFRTFSNAPIVALCRGEGFLSGEILDVAIRVACLQPMHNVAVTKTVEIPFRLGRRHDRDDAFVTALWHERRIPYHRPSTLSVDTADTEGADLSSPEALVEDAAERQREVPPGER